MLGVPVPLLLSPIDPSSLKTYIIVFFCFNIVSVSPRSPHFRFRASDSVVWGRWKLRQLLDYRGTRHAHFFRRRWRRHRVLPPSSTTIADRWHHFEQAPAVTAAVLDRHRRPEPWAFAGFAPAVGSKLQQSSVASFVAGT